MKVGAESEPFKIIRVTSNTALTMDSTYEGETGSLLTYSIFKDEIALWPDLLNIRNIYAPGVGRRREIVPVGPEMMDRNRYRSPFRTGLPEMFTILGNAIYTQKTWATFNYEPCIFKLFHEYTSLSGVCFPS